MIKRIKPSINNSLLFLGLIFSILAFFDRGLSSFDIQLHDTYIVFAKIHLLGLFACLAFLYGMTHKILESKSFFTHIVLKYSQFLLLIGSFLLLHASNPSGQWYSNLSSEEGNEFIATAYSLNDGTGILLVMSILFLIGSFLLFLLQLALYFLQPQASSDLLDH